MKEQKDWKEQLAILQEKIASDNSSLFNDIDSEIINNKPCDTEK